MAEIPQLYPRLWSALGTCKLFQLFCRSFCNAIQARAAVVHTSCCCPPSTTAPLCTQQTTKCDMCPAEPQGRPHDHCCSLEDMLMRPGGSFNPFVLYGSMLHCKCCHQPTVHPPLTLALRPRQQQEVHLVPRLNRCCCRQLQARTRVSHIASTACSVTWQALQHRVSNPSWAA